MSVLLIATARKLLLSRLHMSDLDNSDLQNVATNKTECMCSLILYQESPGHIASTEYGIW